MGQQLERKNKEALEIMKFYAVQAMIFFATVQGSAPAENMGEFWTNHTFKAVEGFFADAWATKDKITLRIANATWYAERLENDFGGKFASFPTIIAEIVPHLIEDLRFLYGERK